MGFGFAFTLTYSLRMNPLPRREVYIIGSTMAALYFGLGCFGVALIGHTCLAARKNELTDLEASTRLSIY